MLGVKFSMNYISGLAHVTNTKMAVTLAHFTSFFQNEAKSIKRGENHYKSGHVESCTYTQVSRFLKSQHAGLGFVVFLVAYFS